jgi:hypothetical protein
MLFVVLSCTSENDAQEEQEPENDSIYFPPLNSDIWETKSISDLNWNESQLQPLLDYLEKKIVKAL